MTTSPTIIPTQCVAARVLLAWDQATLANRSGISRRAIQEFEGGVRNARPATVAAVVGAFEDAGVRFLFEPGPGVQLVTPPA